MKLSDFIRCHLDPILDDWQKFAEAIPSAQGMESRQLRDHARGILGAISVDLDQAQSAEQQSEKAQGRAPHPGMTTEAEMHGLARVTEGFSVSETMAEYRALRASVLRLYGEQGDKQSGLTEELTRFNEAIDQALTESLARYTEIKDRQTRLFEALLSSSPDLNYILDTEGRLVYGNKAFASVVGLSMAELVGANFYELCTPFAPDIERHVTEVIAAISAYRGEMPVGGPDGTTLTYEYLLVPVLDPDGRCEAVAGSARDITERKASEERMRRCANYDYLTDLPNRSLFRERLDHEIRHAARTGLPLALLFIDLDGFKGVNDQLGHAAGDQLLQQVARRITACVRDTDTVARLGGDEFTVILTDITLPPYVETLTHKILETLNKPFPLKAAEVSISGSVGITLYPLDGATLDELVRNADAAMYSAKHAGRNRYRFFSELATADRRH